jgi:hypothetical protein
LNKKSGAKLSKREQLRAERRRRTMTWNALILGGGALVLLLVGYYFFANARPGPLPGEQVIPDEGTAHVDSDAGVRLDYNHYPPSSGTHYGDQIAPWGVYTLPIEEGVFVHNLEHGGVVFLYNCPEACPELEQQFQDFYDKAPVVPTHGTKKILVAPYDRDMPTQIVALAWGHQLNLETFDEATLLQWYRRFWNLGPEGRTQP